MPRSRKTAEHELSYYRPTFETNAAITAILRAVFTNSRF